MERICRALRLAGLPLAVKTGDAGVRLEREGPISGPVDYGVASSHTTSELSDAAETERTEPDRPSGHSPQSSVRSPQSAVPDAVEEAGATVLTASGRVVAQHPYTRSPVISGTAGPRRSTTPLAPMTTRTHVRALSLRVACKGVVDVILPDMSSPPPADLSIKDENGSASGTGEDQGGAEPVVVVLILRQDAAGVGFIAGQDVVESFASARSVGTAPPPGRVPQPASRPGGERCKLSPPDPRRRSTP